MPEIGSLTRLPAPQVGQREQYATAALDGLPTTQMRDSKIHAGQTVMEALFCEEIPSDLLQIHLCRVASNIKKFLESEKKTGRNARAISKKSKRKKTHNGSTRLKKQIKIKLALM